MRSISILGKGKLPIVPRHMDVVDTIDIGGVTVQCCLVHSRNKAFDATDPQNANLVQVRIRAFSCNYRDKSIIIELATQLPGLAYYPVGSEFVGEVVAVGSAVTHLQIGDRVLNNGNYPSTMADAPIGLPTNSASKEYLVIHQEKLLKVPDEMPDTVAAAFGIGAQTTYSMIRKLGLKAGENVWVTAAKSNTSIFAIQALQQYDVNVYATTTSPQFADEIKEMGVKELILLNRGERQLPQDSRLRSLSKEISGFDAVIDPFYDVHLDKAMQVMRIGGRYTTCGWYNQSFLRYVTEETPFEEPNWMRLMLMGIEQNVQLLFNCLGTTEDLQRALDDYAAGALKVTIDTVFSQLDVGAFFDRTYNSSERFGKVVYQYDASTERA